MMEVDNYHCGDCTHYHDCKRIDHDSIKFAVPWFSCYDRNQHKGIVCSDFSPAEWNKWAYKHWPGFQVWWDSFVEQWLPYGNTKTLVYFTLHNNTSIRYGVPLMDYVNGTMIDGNRLKAVEKEYYKRVKTGFGYKLIHEPIDGVLIKIEGGGEACEY